MKIVTALMILSFLFSGKIFAQNAQSNQNLNKMNTSADDYTFQLSKSVIRKKVNFKNRYGITLSGDLYIPKNSDRKTFSALAISGPFGAVKEQSSGLYANQMAEKGFLPWRLILRTLAKVAALPAM